MLFNSYQFVIFFPIVTILYFISSKKYRWLLLLISSCIFYMAFIPNYIFILAALIIIDYVAGILIEKSQTHLRHLFLIISIFANIGLIAIFKYFNFFSSNLGQLAAFFHIQFQPTHLSLILPLGLSFHTFQSLSYVIEIYKKNYKAEKHLGIYALYVMFYPQLVSGPIERPQQLLHQFYINHTFKYKRVIEGLRLILWGLFKKMVIADRLALFVDKIFADPSNHSGLVLIIATTFFSIQIYCDFSGYTDIAIGSAKVMGFKLMPNFNCPYFSKSIVDFWRRWHISLTSWFRDYVYIPLGGNRVKQYRLFFNLMVLFLLSGLWHGANWTFIFWGFLHGLYYVIFLLTSNIRKKLAIRLGLNKFYRLKNLIEVFITFTLVTFAWIFFRANNLRDAFYIVRHLFNWKMKDITQLLSSFNFLEAFLLLLALMIFVWYTRVYKKIDGFTEYIKGQPALIRWAAYSALVLLIMNRGVVTEIPFIYFQF